MVGKHDFTILVENYILLFEQKMIIFAVLMENMILDFCRNIILQF